MSNVSFFFVFCAHFRRCGAPFIPTSALCFFFAGERLVYLSGHFRLFDTATRHFTTDEVVTAHVASQVLRQQLGQELRQPSLCPCPSLSAPQRGSPRVATAVKGAGPQGCHCGVSPAQVSGCTFSPPLLVLFLAAVFSLHPCISNYTFF